MEKDQFSQDGVAVLILLAGPVLLLVSIGLLVLAVIQ